MIKKSKPILLDSNVVITAHELGFWEILCANYQIFLPATVLENELFYFQSSKGKKGLKASEWIKQGKVTRIEAELADYANLSSRLKKDFLISLDAGEREALAILFSKTYTNLLFATADRAAVRALAILNLGLSGISTEELIGDMKKINLPVQHSKKWFKKVLEEGFLEQHLWLN